VATLLVHHADVLVTMDDARREIADGGVFARDGVIEAVGPSDKLPTDADEVINAHGQLVMPGLVNTHHHMSRRSPARCPPRRMPSCSPG
jgi:8-oxoguanine deaminase